jgi:signal peptidase I
MAATTTETTERHRRRVSPALVAAFLAIAIGGFGIGYLRTWPPLAVVMSGSMAPKIDTGDVVVLGKLGRAPQVGDVVAVSVPGEARRRYGYPPTVIHRVVRVDPHGTLVTKGDARQQPDPFTVRTDAVGSHVVATVPAVGQAYAFLTSTLGLIWLAAGALLLVGLPLMERQRDARRAEEETLAALREELSVISAELRALREAEAEAEADFDFDAVDWRVLETGSATPDEPEEQVVVQRVRRRSGGLIGALLRDRR